MKAQEVGKKQLRSFGLIVGVGFTIIGLWPLVFRSEPPRLWALIPAAILAVSALILPGVLRIPFRIWMTIGEFLGWVNTRVILGIVFYTLVTPIGVIIRNFGSDPMRRGFDRNSESYRQIRDKRPASHMKRQY